MTAKENTITKYCTLMSVLFLLIISCQNNNESPPLPPSISILFDLTDSTTNESLFFGIDKILSWDSLKIQSEVVGDGHINSHNKSYFELAGLYRNPNENYNFDLFYNNTYLGVLSLSYKEKIIPETCPSNSNPGSILLFNEEVICENCSREFIYSIAINL